MAASGTATGTYAVTGAASKSGVATGTYAVGQAVSASGTARGTYSVSAASRLFRMVSGQAKRPALYRVVNGRIVSPTLYRVVDGKIVKLTDSVVPVALTRFGACPEPGGTAADVVVKYGQKAMLRQFLGIPGNVPTEVVGASGSHVSWSLGGSANYQTFANGEYDVAVKNAVRTLDPAYFFVEALHEVDNKVNDSAVTVQLGQQVKNRFYDLVKSVNPQLRVVNTLTGYAFSANNPLYTSGQIDSRYGSIKADVIGLDVDGIHSYPYPNMDNRAANAQKWISDHASSGYTDYAFPEWGTRVNQPQDQPDLLNLAAWITKYGFQWKAQPKAPLYACWYDYYNAEDPNVDTRADDQLRVPAPIDALRALVAASPVTAA